MQLNVNYVIHPHLSTYLVVTSLCNQGSASETTLMTISAARARKLKAVDPLNETTGLIDKLVCYASDQVRFGTATLLLACLNAKSFLNPFIDDDSKLV